VFDYSYSDIYNLPDRDCLSTATGIYNKLIELTAELAAYDVTAADLTALQTALEDFRNSLAIKGSAGTQKVAANQTIALLFEDNDLLIYKQLDKLLQRYERTHIDFYNAYTNARKIKATGVRHKKEAEGGIGTTTGTNETKTN
jgi:hypothetical protein